MQEMPYRIVPDSLRERDPIKRGRDVVNQKSKDLLLGKTIFEPGAKKTWGHLYKLASNHQMKCRTKTTVVNDEYGTLIWFEENNAGLA